MARQIVEDDLGPHRRAALVAEQCTPLALAIYRGERAYRAAVDEAVDELLHPIEMGRSTATSPVFEVTERRGSRR